MRALWRIAAVLRFFATAILRLICRVLGRILCSAASVVARRPAVRLLGVSSLNLGRASTARPNFFVYCAAWGVQRNNVLHRSEKGYGSVLRADATTQPPFPRESGTPSAKRSAVTLAPRVRGEIGSMVFCCHQPEIRRRRSAPGRFAPMRRQGRACRGRALLGRASARSSAHPCKAPG